LWSIIFSFAALVNPQGAIFCNGAIRYNCGVAAGLSLGLGNPESRTAVRFDNMP